jgi:sugar lactone lactonase YvrE
MEPFGIPRAAWRTIGPEILEITPPEAATSFVNIPRPTQGPRSSHQPSHIVVGSNGTLFVSDSSSHTIFKVTPEKVVTILAGTPGKSGAADGPGSKALFNSPEGLVLDREGTLYVADSGNQTIRRITPEGEVSTFVGRSGKRGTVDGQGKAARLDRPASIAIDSTGTLYVTNGDDNQIRKVSPAGVVSTVDAEQFIDAP